jgi:hypothetical protein
VTDRTGGERQREHGERPTELPCQSCSKETLDSRASELQRENAIVVPCLAAVSCQWGLSFSIISTSNSSSMSSHTTLVTVHRKKEVSKHENFLFGQSTKKPALGTALYNFNHRIWIIGPPKPNIMAVYKLGKMESCFITKNNSVLKFRTNVKAERVQNFCFLPVTHSNNWCLKF